MPRHALRLLQRKVERRSYSELLSPFRLLHCTQKSRERHNTTSGGCGTSENYTPLEKSTSAMDPTAETAPLSADIQSPPTAPTLECIPDDPLNTSTSTTSTLNQIKTPESDSASNSRPIAPLPIRTDGAANSPLVSPSATRISSRARKPSAKVVEMAEAGPSRPSVAEPKVETKLQPRFLQPDHL
jgi:hypothetical protein